MRRELDILGTWNSEFSAAGNNDDWHAALAAVASGTIDLDCLVTHRVPLEKSFDALMMMKDESEFFAKVLVNPTGEPFSVYLDGNYETLAGKTVSSLNMDPHTGLILKAT